MFNFFKSCYFSQSLVFMLFSPNFNAATPNYRAGTTNYRATIPHYIAGSPNYRTVFRTIEQILQTTKQLFRTTRQIPCFEVRRLLVVFGFLAILLSLPCSRVSISLATIIKRCPVTINQFI